MFGSKSKYFLQSRKKLSDSRNLIVTLLSVKGYNKVEIDVYLKAFDYFVENPKFYDGATIVKDLCDIPGLDLDAMLHDYHYLVYNVAYNPITKFKADWIYAKGQERKGKSQYSSFTRFTGLTLTYLPFVVYKLIIKGFKVGKVNKVAISKDFKILI